MNIVRGTLLTGYAWEYPYKVKDALQSGLALGYSVFGKIQWYGKATAEKHKDYVVRTVRDLDMKEWESLIDLLLEFKGSTEAYVGELLPELALAAVKNGRAEACIFVGSYGGTLWVERLAVREDEAGAVIWQALKEKVQAGFKEFAAEK